LLDGDFCLEPRLGTDFGFLVVAGIFTPCLVNPKYLLCFKADGNYFIAKWQNRQENFISAMNDSQALVTFEDALSPPTSEAAAPLRQGVPGFFDRSKNRGLSDFCAK
jgi:hypothetical protein